MLLNQDQYLDNGTFFCHIQESCVIPKMLCLYNPEKKIVFFVIKWDEPRDNFSIKVLVQSEWVRWQLGFNKNSLVKATKSEMAFTLDLE